MNAEHRHFSKIPSTNSYLKQWAAKSDPSHGTMVTADYQSQGAGQYGRVWTAAAGQNLLMSILLKPRDLPVHEASWITLRSALGLISVLKSYKIPDLTIKWPNDLIAKDRKLVGILTESSIQKDKIQYVIVGIGLNVFTQKWPSEMDPHPICLEELTDRKMIIPDLAHQVKEAIMASLNLSKAEVVEQFNSFLYGRMEPWIFNVDHHRHQATLSHLDLDGNLHFISHSGQKWYTSGWQVRNLKRSGV